MLSNYFDPSSTEQTKNTAGLLHANRFHLLQSMKSHTSASTDRVEQTFKFLFNTAHFITTGDTNFDSRLELFSRLLVIPPVIAPSVTTVSHVAGTVEPKENLDSGAGHLQQHAATKPTHVHDAVALESVGDDVCRSKHYGRSVSGFLSIPKRFDHPLVPRRASSDTNLITAI
jgi:hypothetical protein